MGGAAIAKTGCVRVVLLASVLVVACAESPHVVPLLRTAGAPLTVVPSPSTSLAISTRGTGVADPLPVAGTSVAYADVEPALASAVASAVTGWADEKGGAHARGYSLLVEITQADLRDRDGRLLVNLGVRATLRSRADNAYVAQTHVYCQEAGLVAPERGAPVLYACMAHLGRELSGWLGGIDP